MAFIFNVSDTKEHKLFLYAAFQITNDLLLEFEMPTFRVTYKDFAIVENREKAGGQFAEINGGNTEVTS